MKKRILSVLLIMAVLFTSVPPFSPMPVFAAGVIGAANTYISKPGDINKGGITAATLDTPGYSISLAANETLVSPFLAEDSTAQIKSKVVTQFQSHVPRAVSSIFYFKSSAYRTSGSMGLAYYVPSSGEMVFGATDTTTISAKYRLLSSKSNPGSFISRQLVNKIKAGEKLQDYAGGKWKTLVSGISDATASSLWEYFLFNEGNYNTNVTNYLDRTVDITNADLEKLSPTGDLAEGVKLVKELNYLDLLVSLYILNPGAHKAPYEAAIERFLKEGSNLTKPDLIVVEPAVTFVESGSYYTMRATDAANVMFGATPKHNLYTARPGNPNYTVAANFNARNGDSSSPYSGIRKLIQDTAQAAVAELPTRPRKTDLRYVDGGTSDPSRQDALSWARAPVLGGWFMTQTGLTPRGQYSSFSYDPVFSTLLFSGNLHGFSVIHPSSYTLRLEADGEHKLIVSPEATVVPPAQTTLAINETVKIVTGQNEVPRNKIKALLDATTFSAGYPKLTISLSVDAPTSKLGTGLSYVSGAPSGFAPAFTNTATKSSISDYTVATTKDAIMSMLASEKFIEFVHGTAAVTIAENSTIEYTYKSKIYIQVSATQKILLSAEKDDVTGLDVPAEKTAKAKFSRGSVPVDNSVFTWQSAYPKVFSELKHNQPLAEQFEAMTGVPTDSLMYMSVGGTAYVVDIEMKHHENVETTRTYESNFTATNSEYYTSDRGGPWTVGGYSVPYTGGSWTKTWTGSIPNKATAVTQSGSGDLTVSCPAQPDRTAYNAALAEAQAYAATVNGTVISFTAPSDGVTRTFNGWGASAIGSPSDPQTTSNSGSNWIPQPYVPASGTPGQPGYVAGYQPPPLPGPVTVTTQPGGAGSYTITVTFSMPAYRVSGFGADRVLPSIQDRWTQKVKFDYMEITKARVWKLERGTISGGDLQQLFSVTEVPVSIAAGDPTLFYNIAAQNNSAHNRLRYTLETDQHDIVVWNNGARTSKENGTGGFKPNPFVSLPGQTAKFSGNTYTNSTFGNTENSHNSATALDKATPEWKKFDEQRKLANTVTVISDFIILQTDKGDLPIIYFEDKVNETKQSQQNFSDVKATAAEMWTNNPNSVAQKDLDVIEEVSYLGNYWDMSNKYSRKQVTDYLTTIFDTLPAGKTRTTRPSANTLLRNTNTLRLNLVPNGEYGGWSTEAFYRFIPLTNTSGVNKSTSGELPLSTENVAKYGAPGFTLNAPYSENHDRTNDILVHDPVSAEYAGIISLPSSLDQRTVASRLNGGNLQEAQVETVRKLKDPHPKQEFLFNGDASILNNGSIVNWEYATTDANRTSKHVRNDASWSITGNTFELRKEADYNGTVSYFTETVGLPSKQYTFTGKIGVHRATGYFQIDAISATGAIIQSWQSTAQTSSAVATRAINFKSPVGTEKLKVSMVLAHDGVTTSTYDHLFADDLSLTLVDGTTHEWVPMSYKSVAVVQIPNPDYVTPYTIPNPLYVPEQTVPNPAYIPTINGTTTTFNYTGGMQTYTAPATGTYTLDAWGAQGGGSPSSPSSGGYGGYARSVVNLTAGQTIYIYVGGKGGNSPSNGIDSSTSQNSNGGWNGGGPGSGSRGPGGGGRTNINTSTSQTTELVVGAGGGASASTSWTTTASTANSSGVRVNGKPGVAGHTGNYPKDNGGGGAGYYGGTGMDGDDNSYGYAGTNYSTGAGSTNSYGVRAGHGMAQITSPSQVGNGLPPTITIPASGGDPTITINNANYIPAVVQPTSTNNAWSFTRWNGSSYNSGQTMPTNVGVIQASHVGRNLFIVTMNGTSENNSSYIPVVSQLTAVGSPSNGRQWYRKTITSADVGTTIQITGSPSAWGYIAFFTPDDWNLTSVVNSNSTTINTTTTLPTYILSPLASLAYPNGMSNIDSTYDSMLIRGRSFTAASSFQVATTGVWHNSNTPHGVFQQTPRSGGVTVVSPAVGVPWINGLQPYINSETIQTVGLTEAPEEWYEYVTITIPPDNPISAPNGTFTPGNFILVDREFEVYFPNRGNFYGDGARGVGSLRSLPGMGYTDFMDTTPYTKAKYARFEFPVIYNNQMYLTGEEISLDVNDADGYYQFYVPLAANEAISAEVTFRVEANNGFGQDNELPSNRSRYSNYAALHSAQKIYNVDVVGRIGNLTMVDTGDFRFSNLFKNPLVPDQWLLQNVVKKVNTNSQRAYIGSQIDLRGNSLVAGRNLNTYGNVSAYATAPLQFPLSPSMNSIVSLRNQPLRAGYRTYQDVSTIGNYYNGAIQIIPYYFSVNLQTGVVQPVDVYMPDGKGGYSAINLYGNAVPGWDPNSVADYSLPLNWDDEYGRRNYSTVERTVTENVASAFKVPDANGNFVDMLYPMGKYYDYGNAQISQLTARNRTFFGTASTTGVNRNPGSRLSELEFNLKGQRWHFSSGLPSSAVFVRQGQAPTTANINAIQNQNTVIAMALDIVAIGETFNIRYDGHSNGNITIAGSTVSLAIIPYPVVSITSSTRRSSDDVTTGGTH